MSKKVYEVMNNNPNKKGLSLGKKKWKYGKDNRFFVDDLDEGKALKEKYGIGTGNEDAAINEVELDMTDSIHKYTFQGGIRKGKPPTKKELEREGYIQIAVGRYRKVYDKKSKENVKRAQGAEV